MTYKQTREKQLTGDAKCPKCASTRLLYQRGALTCTNCSHVIYKPSRNKYGAIKTVSKDGLKHNSRFEASVADELHLRKLSGDIKDYDTEYRVDIPLYDEDGKMAHTVRHKVDFRIHHNDQSFELLEAKGLELTDWKWRRMFLEKFWLPTHPDHIYTVRKQR